MLAGQIDGQRETHHFDKRVDQCGDTIRRIIFVGEAHVHLIRNTQRFSDMPVKNCVPEIFEICEENANGRPSRILIQEYFF